MGGFDELFDGCAACSSGRVAHVATTATGNSMLPASNTVTAQRQCAGVPMRPNNLIVHGRWNYFQPGHSYYNPLALKLMRGTSYPPS